MLNTPGDSGQERTPRTPAFLALAKDDKGVALHIPPVPTSIWQRFVAAFDAPEMATDPLYATKELRAKNYHRLSAEISRLMKRRTRAEWLEIFARHDVASAPFNEISDVASDEAIARDHIVVDYPGLAGEHVRSAGPGVLVGDDEVPLVRAPLLGEHTAEILARIGIVDPEADPP
jgi:formyl-CoA transferase